MARILIAEDDGLIALDYELALTGAGHQVCGIVQSGPQAVEAAGSERPDLILMDGMLAHGTSGLTTAGEIRSRWNIPSLVVSGHVAGDAAITAGAVHHLAKPVLPRDLLRVVEELLARLQAEAQTRQ